MAVGSPFRKKLAVFFVALYALCVLAPHAAMAFVHGPNTAHCLTESASAPHQHGVTMAHAHADGAVHEHAQAAKVPAPGKSNDAGAQAACCGLFFMSGLAADATPLLDPATSGKTIASRAPDGLTGHPPGRLNEPPIA